MQHIFSLTGLYDICIIHVYMYINMTLVFNAVNSRLGTLRDHDGYVLAPKRLIKIRKRERKREVCGLSLK